MEMPEAHPVEMRMRAVEAHESGVGSYATVAAMFNVGEASVKRWVWQYRRDGHVNPLKKCGGNRSEVCLKELENIVKGIRDANAGEITAAYNRFRRGKARRHVSSIKRALYRAGYVVKKNGYVRSSSSGRMSS